MRKKAQAALEFLMTYGWALLVILVMVGAFAYLGVTDPQQFIQDKCTLSPGFDCAEIGWINVSGTTHLAVFISNLNDEDVTIIEAGFQDGIDCRPSNNSVFIDVAAGTGSPDLKTSDIRLERKKRHLILLECPDMIHAQIYKVSFELPYRVVRTTFKQILEGEIVIEGTKNIAQ